MNTTTSKRLIWVDVFKAIGIIIMIMGHIEYGNTFSHWFHAFHMPMFFFISGFLFMHLQSARIPLSRFIQKKAKSLLIPYCIFGFINYVYDALIHGFHFAPILAMLTFKNGNGFPIAGALWFLPTLFLVEVIYCSLEKAIKSNKIKAIIFVSIGITGCLINKLLPVVAPYIVSSVLVGIGFFFLGHMCKKYEQKKLVHQLLNMPVLLWFLISLLISQSIFLSSFVNIRTGVYNNVFIFYFNALISILCLINLAKYIVQLSPPTDKLFPVFVIIGSDSLLFLVLNQLFIDFYTRHLHFLPNCVINFIGKSNYVLLFTIASILCLHYLILFFTQFLHQRKLRKAIAKNT